MLKFGKQSSLKQKWELSLKSSSLFVRIIVSMVVSKTNKKALKCKGCTAVSWIARWVRVLVRYSVLNKNNLKQKNDHSIVQNKVILYLTT